MAKIKVKTNKSLKKRIKVTATGKLLKRKAGSGHLKSRKTSKQIRSYRKDQPVPKQYAQEARKMLGLG